MDDNLLEAIKNLSISGMEVKIQSQLERSLYLKLDDALKRIGANWNKQTQTHQFVCDPKPLIAMILKAKKLPEKNPHAFFPTQKREIEIMLNVSGLAFEGEVYPNTMKNINVLEPSAGQGAIAMRLKEVFPNARLDVVENMEQNQIILESLGFEPHKGDFLNFNLRGQVKYDYIFMNPPFSYKKHPRAYIEHIMHAFNMLEQNGCLVAIAPVSFLNRSTKLEKEFYDLVASNLSIEALSSDAFSCVGTNVQTVVLKLEKKAKEKYNGYSDFVSFNFFLTFQNTSKMAELFDETLSDMAKKNSFNTIEIKNMFNRFIEELKAEGIYYPFYIEAYVEDAYCIFKDCYASESYYSILKTENKHNGIRANSDIGKEKQEALNLFDFIVA